MNRSDIELIETEQAPEDNRTTTIPPKIMKQRQSWSMSLFDGCTLSQEDDTHPLQQYIDRAQGITPEIREQRNKSEKNRLRATSAPLVISSAANGGLFDQNITRARARARAETACAAIDSKYDIARSSSPVPIIDEIHFQ